MIAARERMPPLVKGLITGVVSIVAVMGLASVAGYVASQCQCHYTAALFAERDGLRHVELPGRVSDMA